MRRASPDFIDILCGRRIGWDITGCAILRARFWESALCVFVAGPAGKDILEKWNGLDRIDVRARSSDLREHGSCCEISRVARRIVQIRRHAHVYLHRQPPGDVAHIRNLQ